MLVSAVPHTAMPAFRKGMWEQRQKDPIYIYCLLREHFVKEPEWGAIKAKCSESGIQLVKIDKSYFEQPYTKALPHFIIHCTPELHPQLREFDAKHPNIIINQPDAIKKLFKRDTMLKCVENLNISQVGIPKQRSVMDDDDFNDLVTTQGGDLQFPVIIKTMEAGGSKACHKMNYALTMEHLVKLKDKLTISFPFVVQEFHDHGGSFTKVYVLGSRVWCVEKISTDDSALWIVENNTVRMNRNTRQSPPQINENRKLMVRIGSELRKILKLENFNFDVIKVNGGSGQQEFLIVDINYFPGYNKSVDYVALMTAFFQEIAWRPKSVSHKTSCTMMNTMRNTEVLGS